RNVYDLGLNYRVSHWHAYAKIGSSFRFANTDELLGFDAFFNPVFAGDIKPQYARHREVGIGYADSNVDGRIALYHVNVDDEIGYDGILGINTNLDPTRRQGLETELGWNLTEQLRSRLSYSYVEAEFRRGQYRG